jgi:hypothetical protein
MFICVLACGVYNGAELCEALFSKSQQRVNCSGLDLQSSKNCPIFVDEKEYRNSIHGGPFFSGQLKIFHRSNTKDWK